MNCSMLCEGMKPCSLPKTMKQNTQNTQYTKAVHRTPTDLARVILLNRAIPADKIIKDVINNGNDIHDYPALI